MEAVAKTKYLKGSPRKARLVIDLIRGVNVSRALSILKFTDKRAADPIAQCLSSAIANATYKAEQQNIAIDPDDLWVRTCFVDMGPHKHRSRMRPAPQGRAYREQRHYCHITIEVTSDDKPKTEKQLKIEASMATRPVGKKLAAKAAGKAAAKDAKKPKTEKAESKKAKAEEVETPIVNAPDELVPTPVEPTAQDMNAAADAAAQPVDETPIEVATVEAAKADAEVADAKNIETQTTAALNEEKPADEKMEDTNEELERQ
ncbi:MAG TPA: 50S ribosomal protein L22 [Pyrinomonadaceae bacterium]|jgi:large subunit ribosomal protein L22|nr:50S ribosomal protein L22 [Pyrinomonadaceae bacterium]